MYATVAGGLVSFVEPLAAGSGIAEVKTYLNGVHIRGLLAVRASCVATAAVSGTPKSAWHDTLEHVVERDR